MFSNFNTIEEEKTEENYSEPGFLSLVFEFLRLIFRMSLINFAKTKSKFTFDKTFNDYFNQKTKEDISSFQNFICLLSDELKAVKEFSDSNSKDKDFKPKDLNLDILMTCVNNCFLFCVNNLKREELINSLKASFQELISRKKIQANNESKAIISTFHENFDKYVNYINGIKGAKNTEKILSGKKQEINIQKYLDKIQELEKELIDNKNIIQVKEREINQIKKKNEDLNFNLSETKIQSSLDKSTYEEIKGDYSNKINDLLFQHSKEIEKLTEKINKMDNEIQNLKKENNTLKSNPHSKEIETLNEKVNKMDNEIQDLKKENNTLRSKLTLGEKKLETFQVLISAVRIDMNKMANIEKDMAANFDSAIQILEDVKYSLDLYAIDLENLGNIFY